jgi:hypothetical protein
MSRLPQIALCALIPLVLSACGSSSGSSSSGGDRTAKPAKQVLSDVQAAVAKVHSYHLDGTITDKDGRTSLVGDVVAPDSLQFRIRQGGKAAQIVLTSSATYLRASRPFWQAQGGIPAKLVKLLSDRWVKVPGGASGSPRELLGEFTPANLAHCLVAETGTVSKSGTRTFAGRRVVVLQDKGDKPGSNPGLLYVAASGPALPLRVLQTGRAKPGGRHDPRCDSGGGDSTTNADVRLSGFDKPVNIKAPPGALDLDKLGAGGASGSGGSA